MWQEKDHGLYKEFTFKDFAEAFQFMELVAAEAEAEQHHPRWQNEYNRVQIWLSTHEAGDTVSEKDHKLAQKIDEIFAKAQITQNSKAIATQETAIKLFADGGSRGNPGPSASGYVFLDMNEKIILERGIYLGITTNNQAEYTALKLGLEEAQQMGIKRVDVYMDSLLVINQMMGRYKVKNAELMPIHKAIQTLMQSFELVTFTHVPRALNKLADAMVNRALDEQL